MKQIVIEVPDGVQVQVKNTTTSANAKPERTIEDLRDGEVAWTVPWALAEFRFGRLGIHKGYPAYSKSDGTVSMKIQRESEIILVEMGTANSENTTHWGREQCMPARLVKAIVASPQKITIIIA